jgi:DNA-binding beta-propeller fold protein YncE
VARSSRLGILVLAFIVAGCSAQAIAPRPSDPAASTAGATDTPRPTNASSDIIYVRSNDGLYSKILVLDARTGQTLRTLSDGALSANAATVYSADSVSGATKTAIHLTDLATGTDLRTFTVDGDLRPARNPMGTFSALTGDGALTSDGRLLALMNSAYKLDNEWLTKFAVVNTDSGAIVSSTEFRGQSTFGFIALAPDGRSLFLEQYGDGGTRLRVFDVATATLVDATGPGLATTGFRTPGVLSPDGRWMYRLDAGSQATNCTSTDGPSCVPNGSPPYVVALDLVTRRAAQLTLPNAQRSSDFEKYLLWSLALTPDGATLYAVNPALGVIDEVDARQMSLRRTAPITVARASGDGLTALARLFFPVADAKRYITGGALLSPDGRTLYAAAHDGLSVIDTASLASRAVWQRTHQFDTLRLSSDGRRLYAMDNMAGKLVLIDTTAGASLGEIKLQYAPAILRIDSGN